MGKFKIPFDLTIINMLIKDRLKRMKNTHNESLTSDKSILSKPAKVRRLTALCLSMLLCAATAVSVYAGTFKYEHDPRLNSKAMTDARYDPDAVYGFVPREDSTRLAKFASVDFTDETVVAESKKKREAYHETFTDMYNTLVSMEQEGKSYEEIARTISPMRNQIRLASYTDEEGLKKVKASNLQTYGQEDGPSADQLFEKYGSWETVIYKCFGSNSGMDACLGLYDDDYEFNLLTGAVTESDKAMYTVQQGDCLSEIAYYYLADPSQWKTIYNANRDKIKNSDLIYVGQVIYIPLD